jgi:hypothetical protein
MGTWVRAVLGFVLVGFALSATALVPRDAAASHAGAPEPIVEADSAPSLGGFLDETGHLILPSGFSGSLNPAGYRRAAGTFRKRVRG